MFDVVDETAFASAQNRAENSVGKTAERVRALLVAETAYARTSLGALCGDGSSVLVVHPDALAADWPAYIAARAKTGGALVAEAGVSEPPADFAPLGEGRLFGRPARAGLVGGALIFWIADAPLAIAA